MLFIKSLMSKRNLLILVAVLIVAFSCYRLVVLPWFATWGSTAEERAMRLPGDELVPPNPILKMDHAITINAPVEKVFPYLLQMGQDKAGFYSYDWLERLGGFGIYNTYVIKPEWQDLKAGDFCVFHQNGMGMRIHSVEKNKFILMITDSREPNHLLPPGKWEFFPVPKGKYVAWNWSFNVFPLPDGKTRLVIRSLSNWTDTNPLLNFALGNAFELTSVIMDRKLCLTVKRLAEESVAK